MEYGKQTNTALINLIASGKVSFGDTAFSINNNTIVKYNGTYWQSLCNCYAIGTVPECFDQKRLCMGVTKSSGTIVFTNTGIGDYSVLDYSPVDYNTN